MITAAHCLHSGSSWLSGAWLESPGVDSQDVNQTPYGTETCVWGTISGAYAAGSTGAENDYAVIEFSGCGRAPGNAVGWLGVWSRDDTALENQTMYIYGYPGDNDSENNCTLCCVGGSCLWPSIWGSGSATNAKVSGTDRIRYDTDATGGQSGSAVYNIYNSNRYVVGVHKGHSWSLWDGWFNTGRRVNNAFMSFLETHSAWRRSSFFYGQYASVGP